MIRLVAAFGAGIVAGVVLAAAAIALELGREMSQIDRQGLA